MLCGQRKPIFQSPNRAITTRLYITSLINAAANGSTYVSTGEENPGEYMDLHSIRLSFNSLNNPLTRGRRLIEPNLPQPYRLKQPTPLVFGALKRSNLHHHHDAHTRRGQITVHVGQDVLVDDQTGVSRLHCIHNVKQDGLAFLVGPVVEDPVHEICPCTWTKAQ